MSRIPLSALLLLGVVCVGLGTVGVVSPADAPLTGESAADTATVTNTTNYLSLSGETPTRQEYARSNVDVAAAVGVDSERLQGRLDAAAFDRRYGATDGEDARIQFVQETVTQTETRLERLDDRHGQLLQSYSEGSLSRDAFLRQLVKLEADAAEARALLEQIRTRAEQDPSTTIPVALETRLAALRAELVTLPGPMSSRVVDSVTGTTEAFPVYVGGAGNGLVLATADDSAFVREATLRSEYAPGEPNQFAGGDDEPISVAFERAQELYPWAFSNYQSLNRFRGFGDSEVYYFDLSHPHGEIQSYIHGGSGNVFREHHQQPPDAAPVQLTAETESDGLELSVNASAETGPMRISVERTTPNVPAAATVRIDGQPVGTTGSDGELWTIRPNGSFTVNATTDDGASVDLSAP